MYYVKIPIGQKSDLADFLEKQRLFIDIHGTYTRAFFLLMSRAVGTSAKSCITLRDYKNAMIKLIGAYLRLIWESLSG